MQKDGLQLWQVRTATIASHAPPVFWVWEPTRYCRRHWMTADASIQRDWSLRWIQQHLPATTYLRLSARPVRHQLEHLIPWQISRILRSSENCGSTSMAHTEPAHSFHLA